MHNLLCLGFDTAKCLHCVYHYATHTSCCIEHVLRFKSVLHSEGQCFHGTWRVFCTHKSIRTSSRKTEGPPPEVLRKYQFYFELCCVRKFNLISIISKYLVTLKNAEDILGLALLTIQPGVRALYKHRQHNLLISMQVWVNLSQMGKFHVYWRINVLK